MKYFNLLLLLLSIGCVQVPGDNVAPAPGPSVPVPSPGPQDQFAGVDETLVANILAAPELRDPVRLRRYAALYRGMTETLTDQPEVPTLKIILGGLKATEQFIKPRSPAIQAILKSYFPPPPYRDADRAVYASKFASLSLACHAAAHRLENPTK